MSPVIFAPAALRDIERLRAFLRPRNPSAAQRAGAAILQGVQALGLHPRMGRTVNNLPDQYREWLIAFGHSGYVARYRIDEGGVTILAVRHQREAEYTNSGLETAPGQS